MRLVGLCLSLLAALVFVNPVSAAEDGHDEKPHWSYEGSDGPEKWAYLSPEFQECGVGQYQSPIDIKANVDANLPNIFIDYDHSDLNVVNNGHTLQVNYGKGNVMKVGSDTYELLQFHFHTPSEYAINGKRADMEVHFVHKRDDGALGVLGIMMNVGAANDTIEKIWANAPVNKGTNVVDGELVNASDLLPSNMSYFRLMGSLTTPPCSEGVNWHVLATPITLSQAQLEKFKSIFPHNARPLQPTNDRLIVKDN